SHSQYPSPTRQISTLSLHDALPIWLGAQDPHRRVDPVGGRMEFRIEHDVAARDRFPRDRLARQVERATVAGLRGVGRPILRMNRSEEHTSELQSRENLVCRLLLEKK